MYCVKPYGLAVSFKGKDVCCNPVKKPPVMAIIIAHPPKFSIASSSALRVFTSRSFVGSSRSRTCLLPWVSLQGERGFSHRLINSPPFLLVSTWKIKPCNIGPGVYLPVSKLNGVMSAWDRLPYGFFRREYISALITYASFTVSPILNSPDVICSCRWSSWTGWFYRHHWGRLRRQLRLMELRRIGYQ